MRSTRRSSSLSTSRPAPGERPSASAWAYAPGCFTFHQRTPPTWLCAPGPAPHQSAPRQYSSLCRQRPASVVAQLETSYQWNPAAANASSAMR